MAAPQTLHTLQPQQLQQQQMQPQQMQQQQMQQHQVTAEIMQAAQQQASQQFYVSAVATNMQVAPPAIAPAPQAVTTTVSALQHQPMQHQIHQQMQHPGISPSPMPQFQPQQVQVIQGSIPGGPYFQQFYQNAQGQLIMQPGNLGNLTLQAAPAGMSAASLQQNALNSLNQQIQVIAAPKQFQGQMTNHMLTATAGKGGILQAGYAGGIPTSGSQTLVIGQLPVGMISNQQPNLMPAQQAGVKAGDMQKITTSQYSGAMQGITWAAPGTLHSFALPPQNQPIFIRQPHPGQENVYIQSPHPQMQMSQSMLAQMSAMTQQQPQPPQPQQHQQMKPRTGLEMQANIQPKAPTMRPPILPNMTTGQMRPGTTVSSMNIGQMGTPRAQTKVRGKNANRAAAAAAAVQQQQQLSVAAAVQHTGQMTVVSSNSADTGVVVSMGHQMVGGVPVSMAIPVSMTMSNKPTMTTVQSMPTMTQAKHNIPMAPPTAPLSQGGHNPQHQNMIRMQGSKTAVTTVLTSGSPTMASGLSAAQLQSQPLMMSTAPAMSSAVPTTVLAPITVMAAGGQPLATVVSQPFPGGPQPLLAMAPGGGEKMAGGSGVRQLLTNGIHGSGLPGGAAGNTVSESGEVSESHDSISDKGHKNPGQGKATVMVKPQMLTHVIEGFVIHEAAEPFPVSRSSLLTDISKIRPNNSHLSPAPTSGNGTQSGKENLPDEAKDTKVDGRCEFCGKIDKVRVKKNKKFCSSNCAKRFAAAGNFPKRVGSFPSPDEGPTKRKREEGNESEGGASGIEGGRGSDTSEEIGSPGSPQKPRVDILKWTVKDVVNFVENLPGCREYAEDFALQEIDGQALLLLKADHLMQAMSMKLGPALKICAKIESMRGERKET